MTLKELIEDLLDLARAHGDDALVVVDLMEGPLTISSKLCPPSPGRLGHEYHNRDAIWLSLEEIKD